jgi:flagellar biosynthesis GTPase FlhF
MIHPNQLVPPSHPASSQVTASRSTKEQTLSTKIILPSSSKGSHQVTPLPKSRQTSLSTSPQTLLDHINIDKMNESSIRGWFAQFGPISQILVDTSWNKAILVYEDYESAAKAWNDPRPVFAHRFVKIWWKKTDAMESAPELSGTIVDEVELEIAREAAKKAQKEHEEKQRRKKELEKKKEELERQRIELVERQKLEREKLMEKIKRAEIKAAAKKAEAQQQQQQMQQQQQQQQQPAAIVKNGMTTPSSTTESPATKPTNDSTPQETTPPNDTNRKAHLQKMLSDLHSQVPHPTT